MDYSISPVGTTGSPFEKEIMLNSILCKNNFQTLNMSGNTNTNTKVKTPKIWEIIFIILKGGKLFSSRHSTVLRFYVLTWKELQDVLLI